MPGCVRACACACACAVMKSNGIICPGIQLTDLSVSKLTAQSSVQHTMAEVSAKAEVAGELCVPQALRKSSWMTCRNFSTCNTPMHAHPRVFQCAGEVSMNRLKFPLGYTVCFCNVCSGSRILTILGCVCVSTCICVCVCWHRFVSRSACPCASILVCSPEKAVAKELGICLTSLKKLCRSYGITFFIRNRAQYMMAPTPRLLVPSPTLRPSIPLSVRSQAWGSIVSWV
jgi:hypothetical protein